MAGDAIALLERVVELVGEHEARKPQRTQVDYWLYNRVRETVGTLP